MQFVYFLQGIENLDVILLGGVLVVAAIYLIAKSDCKF